MTVKDKEMQHVTVELNIPDTVQVPDYYDWGEAQVAQMYRAGIMSGREAAQTLGVPHRDIIDVLGEIWRSGSEYRKLRSQHGI